MRRRGVSALRDSERVDRTRFAPGVGVWPRQLEGGDGEDPVGAGQRDEGRYGEQDQGHRPHRLGWEAVADHLGGQGPDHRGRVRQPRRPGRRPLQRHRAEQHGFHARLQRHGRVQPPARDPALQLVLIRALERHGVFPTDGSSGRRRRYYHSEAAAGDGPVRPQRAAPRVAGSKAAAIQPRPRARPGLRGHQRNRHVRRVGPGAVHRDVRRRVRRVLRGRGHRRGRRVSPSRHRGHVPAGRGFQPDLVGARSRRRADWAHQRDEVPVGAGDVEQVDRGCVFHPRYRV
mmetsp:Transcript_5830/g.22064  ORF Transcript_5830/g.22064 Transcript_5830/m.22064 type:complete len:287 (-) Transcript_5830:2918-3778(-)